MKRNYYIYRQDGTTATLAENVDEWSLSTMCEALNCDRIDMLDVSYIDPSKDPHMQQCYGNPDAYYYLDEEGRYKPSNKRNPWFQVFVLVPEETQAEIDELNSQGLDVANMVPKDEQGYEVFDVVGDVVLEAPADGGEAD